jgi:hypothetical protein
MPSQDFSVMAASPHYIASARIAQKAPLPTGTQPLLSNCCFSGSTVLVLNKYATILFIGYLTTFSVTTLYNVGRYNDELERSGRGLTEILSPHLPGRTEGNHEALQSEESMFLSRFEPKTCRIQV